jgi:hypothetical protein
MHKLVSRCSNSNHLIPAALAALVPVSSIVSLLAVAALAIPSLRWLLLGRLTVSLLRVRDLVSLLVSGGERIVVARLEARRRWCAVSRLLVTWLLVPLLLVARLLISWLLLVSWLLVSRLLISAVALRRRASGLRWSSVAVGGGGTVVVDVS